MAELPKKGLGRGLQSLISDEGYVSISHEPPVRQPEEGGIGTIPVDQIGLNPFQPRKEFDETALEELKNSIIENGVIQPVTVCRDGDRFQLISGERRLRAVTKAGFRYIPAYIVEAHDDATRIELALIENIQREDLNAIEVALALRSLSTKCNLSQEEIARKVGKNRSTISNFLRLLKLPLQIQDSIRNREISSGHARALINLPGEQQQLDLWKKIIDNQLSVRQTEALVNRMFRPESDTARQAVPEVRTTYLSGLETRLRENFSAKVKILEKKGGKGEIHIQYFSHDDLERLMTLMERS